MDNLSKLAYGLSPLFGMYFEAHLFNRAKEQLEGYNGGQWGEFSRHYRSKDRWFALPPEMEKYHLTCADNYADVTVDRFTAGAGLTVVAWNLALWAVSQKIKPSIVEFIRKEFYTLKDCCLSDKRINTQAFLSYID